MDQNLQKFVEEFYGLIIERSGVLPDDFELQGQMKEALDVLLPGVVIKSIWQNMTDSQLKHFNDYALQTTTIDPSVTPEDMLCAFADMYDDLSEKVSIDLDQFVEGFIAEMNLA